MQAVLVLQTTITHQQKEIVRLEMLLANAESFDVNELSLQLDDAHGHLASLEQGMHRKQAALGVDDQVDLRRLQDAFLHIQMNSLALKERIRDRLRQRKFEIEKLERNYRHNTNSMHPVILADLLLKTFLF